MISKLNASAFWEIFKYKRKLICCLKYIKLNLYPYGNFWHPVTYQKVQLYNGIRLHLRLHNSAQHGAHSLWLRTSRVQKAYQAAQVFLIVGWFRLLQYAQTLSPSVCWGKGCPSFHQEAASIPQGTFSEFSCST